MRHKHLPALRETLMKELKLDAGETWKRAA
jgi:hypothetical protein